MRRVGLSMTFERRTMSIEILSRTGTVLYRATHARDPREAVAEAVGRSVDLSDADLPGIQLAGTSLEGAELSRASLAGARFDGCNLEDSELRQADLRGASLDGSNLEGVDLSRATLVDASLRGSNLESARLDGADLSRAVFDGSNLEQAELHGAVLGGARFDRANLEGANLERVSAAGASFVGANLEKCDLRDAELSGANFEGANLERCDLRGARLVGARLVGANLEKCDLRRADLAGGRHGGEPGALRRRRNAAHGGRPLVGQRRPAPGGAVGGRHRGDPLPMSAVGPEASRRSDGPVCAACGRGYTESSWTALPAVVVLGPTDLEKLVVSWPGGRVVQVRACARCGHRMARLGDVPPCVSA